MLDLNYFTIYVLIIQSPNNNQSSTQTHFESKRLKNHSSFNSVMIFFTIFVRKSESTEKKYLYIYKACIIFQSSDIFQKTKYKIVELTAGTSSFRRCTNMSRKIIIVKNFANFQYRIQNT